MDAFLARCRISCQIATLGVVGVLGMLLVAGINQWGNSKIALSDTLVAEARDANALDGNLQALLLQARRHEKDFLLRRDEKSLATHAATIIAINAATQKLAAALSTKPDALAKVTQIQADIGNYAKSFLSLATAGKTVGLNENLGLQGELRLTVHDVEERLKDVNAAGAQIAMLMMRRHEKDFLLRLDPKYGADMKARMPEFVAALNDVSTSDENRTELIARMSAYQASFQRLIVAKLAEIDAAKALSEIYRGIEPRLVALDELFAGQAAAETQRGDAVAESTHRLVLLSLGGVVVFVALLCSIIGRGIARPIVAVTRSMEALVAGDLNAPVPDDRRRDEIGTMVHAVRAFRDSLREAALMRELQAQQRERAEEDKKLALVGMATQIETEAGSAVETIGERTKAMTVTADEMLALAGRTGQFAQDAANAASVALGNAQTVASASEELAASIREISAQVNQSTAVVGQAVEAGTETRSTIEMLNERVGRIGAVADIIGDIAAKTNLLALNATIEAARAGEAGKGFAVVASEVKQLASQTARSTEEITRHISDVRAATSAAVTAVGRIEATIDKVSEIAGSIAAAVEQQGAATAEIARNVTETATAVNDMSQRNSDVSREAQQAGLYAEEVLTNTRILDDAVGQLRHTIIRTVRTSTEEVNRRTSARYNIERGCEVDLNGRGRYRAKVSDLSLGGAQLIGLDGIAAGATGMLRLDGLATVLPFRVIDAAREVVRVVFNADDNGYEALAAFLRDFAGKQAA